MVATLAAAALACTPHAGLGTVTYHRGTIAHVVDLETCRRRTFRSAAHRPEPLVSGNGRWAAAIRSTGQGRTAKQTIWITDRRSGKAHPAFSETQYYKTIGPGETPGPILLLAWSGDNRWIFFAIDPGGSASIAADGLTLRVVSAQGGRPHRLARMLLYPDYLAWCGGRLVFTAGFDRTATNTKRLLVASPPQWRPRLLVPEADRAWGSLTCSPNGRSVVAQSQAQSGIANFFGTRWSLWRVGFDGSSTRLTSPPAQHTDESPRFSRDGKTILFVRSRKGIGQLYALRDRSLLGPLLSLGYSLGYYGHQYWWAGMDWSLGVRQP